MAGALSNFDKETLYFLFNKYLLTFHFQIQSILNAFGNFWYVLLMIFLFIISLFQISVKRRKLQVSLYYSMWYTSILGTTIIYDSKYIQSFFWQPRHAVMMKQNCKCSLTHYTDIFGEQTVALTTGKPFHTYYSSAYHVRIHPDLGYNHISEFWIDGRDNSIVLLTRCVDFWGLSWWESTYWQMYIKWYMTFTESRKQYVTTRILVWKIFCGRYPSYSAWEINRKIIINYGAHI